jgi:hypothetical protein
MTDQTPDQVVEYLTTVDHEPTDPRYLTEDKAPITHGALLFNYYDGYRVQIVIEGTWADPRNEFHEHWNGWFDTLRVDADGTKSRGPSLNGQRMCSIEGARRYGHLRD